MKGNVLEFSLAKEPIADGAGGETPGIVVRVWLDDGEGEKVLALTLSVRDEEPTDIGSLRHFVEGWLSVWEIE